MAAFLEKKFLLWSAIFVYNFLVYADIPRLRLANGTVLSDYQEIIIEYGNPLELFCTGNSTNIQMYKNGEKLVSDSINKTTVRLFTENPERQDLYYYCYDSKDSNAIVKVVVDSAPLVSDFFCKSKNLDYINCSWISPNIAPKFSLYYIKEEISHKFLLCKVGTLDSRYCVWDSKNPITAYENSDYDNLLYQQFDAKLTFMMETCNRFGCVNQMFLFGHVDIIQLDPPKLDLLQISSHSASLKWNIPWKLWLMDYLSLKHRISYWYSGVHQIQVNTKSLEENYVPTFELELTLPCAGTFYEVRLSIKPETADGEEFWSEDAVISFVTDPEPKEVADVVDPTCTRPRVTITTEIMLYEIEKLRDKMEKEKIELKERIKSWKLRVEKDQTDHAFNKVAETAEI